MNNLGQSITDYQFRNPALKLFVVLGCFLALLGLVGLLITEDKLGSLCLFLFGALSAAGVVSLGKRLSQTVEFFEHGLRLTRGGNATVVSWEEVGEVRELRQRQLKIYEVSLGKDREPLRIMPSVEGAKAAESLLAILEGRRKLAHMGDAKATVIAEHKAQKSSPWP